MLTYSDITEAKARYKKSITFEYAKKVSTLEFKKATSCSGI